MRLLCAPICLWLLSNGFSQPGISAKSAVVMDAETGAVLFERNARATRFPASTTKVMTALLLVERCGPQEKISAPAKCRQVTGASLYLEPGEQVSADDLLYALLLRSANDAAHAVACHIGGSIEGFCKLMNRRAKELGCENTNFRNPHGLNDELHTTTAYDLALIAREAMSHERFRRAAAARHKWISRSINQEDLLVVSKNRFLKEEPNAEGIKTGWTRPAGRCFVGAKSVEGWRLISVVLGSEDWLADTKALFDWAYQAYEQRGFVEGEVIGQAPVRGGVAAAVEARAGRRLTFICSRGAVERRPALEWRSVEAPVREGQPIGVLKVEAFDGRVLAAPVVAAASVDTLPVFRFGRGWGFWLTLVCLIGTVAIGAKLWRMLQCLNACIR